MSRIDQTTTAKAGRTRAIVIKANGDREAASDSVAVIDPWENVRGDGLIAPPFDQLGLSMIWESSTILRQCIEVMAVNIAGHGWILRERPDVAAALRGGEDAPGSPGESPGMVDEALRAAVMEEREEYEEFLSYIDYDGHSLTNLRSRVRFDLEATGNAYLEVIRDKKERLVALRYIPAYMVRLGREDVRSVETQQRRPAGRGRERSTKTVSVRRRFRFYAQVQNGSKKSLIFFKAYGDPRRRNRADGKLFNPKTDQPQLAQASEILHLRIPAPRTPYGIPRWIGVLLTTWGSRAAEEINYITMRNNNVPSMFVLASNGFLTDGSLTRLEEFMEENVAGSDNYSKIVVLEAEPLSSEEGEESGNTRLEVKEVASAQHGDALFKDYDAKNRDKVREAFRLAPVFIGQTSDYTKATADVSRRIVDEQVFAPERREEDSWWTRLLVDTGMTFHTFRSNGPNVSDDENLARVMAHAERSGAMTPRRAQIIVEDILGWQFTDLPHSIDLDIPFSLQMAEAVKNMAMPQEVGQQVTALKTLAEAKRDAGQHDDAVVLEKAAVALEYTYADAAKVAGGGPTALVSAAAAARAVVAAHKAGAAGDGGEPAALVALRVPGVQARKLADNDLRILLSDVALGLRGREMVIVDNDLGVAAVKARFGGVERLSVDQAASLAGLEKADVEELGREELYGYWVTDVIVMDEPLTVPAGDDLFVILEA